MTKIYNKIFLSPYVPLHQKSKNDIKRPTKAHTAVATAHKKHSNALATLSPDAPQVHFV